MARMLSLVHRIVVSLSLYSGHRRRRRSGWNSGGGRKASAEGGSVPSGEGCALSSRLGGPGSVVSYPSGSGAEFRPKTDFGVFWRPQNAPFCTYMTKIRGAICISVPLLQILVGLVITQTPIKKKWGKPGTKNTPKSSNVCRSVSAVTCSNSVPNLAKCNGGRPSYWICPEVY